jgi:hypothetical protein
MPTVILACNFFTWYLLPTGIKHQMDMLLNSLNTFFTMKLRSASLILNYSSSKNSIFFICDEIKYVTDILAFQHFNVKTSLIKIWSEPTSSD